MSKIAGFGSYEQMTPSAYRTFYPDNAQTEVGSDGWSIAPMPGWGENPNLVGQPRIATNGLGITPITVGRSYGPVFVGRSGVSGGSAAPSPWVPLAILAVLFAGAGYLASR